MEHLTDNDLIKSFINNIRPLERDISTGKFSRSIGYPENRFTNEEISAVRVSMALSVLGMMKVSLGETIKNANVKDVVTILAGPLNGKKFIKSVNLLREWLSENGVWNVPDKEIKKPKNVAEIRKETKNRKGVCIISIQDSNVEDGYATLWTGDNIISGHEYLDGNRFVYFWELKGCADLCQRLFEAQLKAAKILYDEHIGNDNIEHSISIFRKSRLSGNSNIIQTDEYFLVNVKHGNNGSSVTPDYASDIHKLAAIVHTHAETNESHDRERELSIADQIISYDKDVPISLITSDVVLKTVQSIVDADNEEDARKSVEILKVLTKFNSTLRLTHRDERVLSRILGDTLKERCKNDVRVRMDTIKTHLDHYENLTAGYMNICKKTEIKIFVGKT